MTDIVERLRKWTISRAAVPCGDLMDEAAEEIERLRKAPCPHVMGRTTQYCSLTPLTLTSEEREAVGWFARHSNHGMSMRRSATLRSLLSRIGDFPEPENATNEDNVLTAAERLVLRGVCETYADEDDVKSNEIAYVIDRILARTGK
jgi:hypothetical protein